MNWFSDRVWEDRHRLALTEGESPDVAAKNARRIMDAVHRHSYVQIRPGRYFVDPIRIESRNRPVISAEGVYLLPSRACAGRNVIEIFGTSITIHGLRMRPHIPTHLPTSYIHLARSGYSPTGQGADPGTKFMACEVFGLATYALLDIRGAELFESYASLWANSADEARIPAPTVQIHNLGSTTRFNFTGGQITNVDTGRDSACVRTVGMVQELSFNDVYFMSGGGDAVLANGLPSNNHYLDRLSLNGCRMEGNGSMVRAQGAFIRNSEAKRNFHEGRDNLPMFHYPNSNAFFNSLTASGNETYSTAGIAVVDAGLAP